MKIKESQNVEFKESWRDDYLKWICGFANAQGGTIYVGVDDNGNVVGVDDAKKLMDYIPIKVRDMLGIVVDVNLLNEDGKDVIQIITEPYPTPVSYKGEFHYRSGSTKLELKGISLEKFLFAKAGRTWDSVPIMHLKLDELSDGILQFRKLASKSNRIELTDLESSDDVLMEKLHLMDDENKMLKRAAAILFYDDPERFVTGAYVKIGYFDNNANILYQDEIHGNIFTQIYETMKTLTKTYLRALISYDGIQRIERYPVPLSAIRETLINSLAHKVYGSATPVQIKVYDYKLSIWNAAELPFGWDAKKLTSEHESRPYNPDIANALFRSGEIEQWGRGIKKVIGDCRSALVNDPQYKYEAGGLTVTFNYTEEYVKGIFGDKVTIPNDTENEVQGATDKQTGKQEEKQCDFNNDANDKTLRLRNIIIESIKNNPKITRAEIAQKANVSASSIRRILFQMKDVVKYVGSGNYGHWEIIKE